VVECSSNGPGSFIPTKQPKQNLNLQLSETFKSIYPSAWLGRLWVAVDWVDIAAAIEFAIERLFTYSTDTRHEAASLRFTFVRATCESMNVSTFSTKTTLN